MNQIVRNAAKQIGSNNRHMSSAFIKKDAEGKLLF